jgi:hypothetical protein
VSDDSYLASEGEGSAEAPAPDYDGQGAAEAPPEPTYLDTDSYSGHHVRVKVDGEEVAVPLSEALGGYQRQADYTRKTQELARQQQDAQFALTLQRALENNPAQTLRILQEQYGLDQEATTADDDAWMDDDPVEQRLREYDQRLSVHEEYRAQQELRVALGVLQQRYGQDFDPVAVATRAGQMGRMDLENVYKEMAFERYWQTEQQTRAQQAKEAQRVAAKQQLTPHGGSGTNGAVAEPQRGSSTSIAAAFQEAKRQHGVP